VNEVRRRCEFEIRSQSDWLHAKPQLRLPLHIWFSRIQTSLHLTPHAKNQQLNYAWAMQTCAVHSAQLLPSCIHNDPADLSKQQCGTANAFSYPGRSNAFWGRTKTLKLAGRVVTPALYRMPAVWPYHGPEPSSNRLPAFGQGRFAATVRCSHERVFDL
jgi:hypothetical protein